MYPAPAKIITRKARIEYNTFLLPLIASLERYLRYWGQKISLLQKSFL